jgi:hypothetical protein
MQEYSPLTKNLNISRLMSKYKYDSARKPEIQNPKNTSINIGSEGGASKNASVSVVPVYTSEKKVKATSHVCVSSRKSKIPIYERVKLPVLQGNEDIEIYDEKKVISKRIRKKTCSVNITKEILGDSELLENIYERGVVVTSHLRNSSRERHVFVNLFHKLFELWIDIDLNIEKKGNLIAVIKNFFVVLEKETQQYEEDENIINFFNSNKLNILLLRMIKLQILILSTLLILLTNFYTENHMKVQYKRLISAVSIPLYTFYNIYLIQEGCLSKEYSQKLDLLKKNHKIQYKDISDPLTSLERGLELAMLLLKQLARYIIII